MQVFSISYLISCPHFKIQLSLIHATEKIILLDSGENWPSDYTSSITHDLYSSVQFFSPPFPKYSSINSCKNLGSVILQGIFKPWWHCRHRVNPPCLAIHAQTNPMHPQMCKCFVHKINKHTQCALCKSVCVDIYMYIIMHYNFFFLLIHLQLLIYVSSSPQLTPYIFQILGVHQHFLASMQESVSQAAPNDEEMKS